MSRITLLLKTNEGGLWTLPQIRELSRQGHVVTVILPAGDGRLRRRLDEAHVPVADSPFDFSFSPSLRLITGVVKLRRLIRATSPDVVFYHLYASALAARCACVGLRVRRVHMVAGPLYLDSTAIRWAERCLCRLDDHLIAGSDHTARRYTALGLAPSRMSVSPYGVDTTEFRRLANRREQLFGCSSSTFVAIMVAYVYAPKRSVHQGKGIKGHDVLLAAWKIFSASHPDCLLVLVGAGFGEAGERHRQQLQATYAVGNDSTVLWRESVDDVRPLYSSSDLSVSPSRSDNHGAALEASAMSLPSIVSDAGALPEAVTAETGWLVRAGDVDHLAATLSAAHESWRSGQLEQMGAAARRMCERRFSHQVVLPPIAGAVVGRPRPALLAITEQRTWLEGDVLRGRKSLPIVSALAARVPVRLAARVGAPGRGGVTLAPNTVPAFLPCASVKTLVGGAMGLLALARSVVLEVRDADVIYADQPGVVGALGLVAGKALRKPLVVNVVGDSHESVHPSVISGVVGRVAHAVLPRAQRWACANATYVNYVTASVLQSRYPPTRARASFAFSTASALGPARPRSFPRGRVSVVTVTSLEQPYKGVADLIDAIKICRTDGWDVVLTVVGEGRLRPDLEEHAKAAVPDHVVFAGQLYGDDLYQELGRHCVFALSSWTEGLPRALIEAMADGLPAVATAVGGVPELLEPERTAPPRDERAFAVRLTELLRNEGQWLSTIDHNLAVSKRVFAERGDGLERFVEAISRLAASVSAGHDR